MKRIVLWLLSTLSVLVLLFGYHTSTSGVSSAASPPAVISGSTSGASSTGGSSGSSKHAHSGAGSARSGSGSSGSGSSGSAGSTRGSGSASRSQSPSRSPSPSPSPSPSQSPATTVTGDVAQTQWGPVQVELTVKNGSITGVSVLQYPSGNSTDAQINNYALPILMRETTTQQSARIDMVGGATVTSTGYLQSLQSAIDQAGL